MPGGFESATISIHAASTEGPIHAMPASNRDHATSPDIWRRTGVAPLQPSERMPVVMPSETPTFVIGTLLALMIVGAFVWALLTLGVRLTPRGGRPDGANGAMGSACISNRPKRGRAHRGCRASRSTWSP